MPERVPQVRWCATWQRRSRVRHGGSRRPGMPPCHQSLTGAAGDPTRSLPGGCSITWAACQRRLSGGLRTAGKTGAPPVTDWCTGGPGEDDSHLRRPSASVGQLGRRNGFRVRADNSAAYDSDPSGHRGGGSTRALRARPDVWPERTVVPSTRVVRLGCRDVRLAHQQEARSSGHGSSD